MTGKDAVKKALPEASRWYVRLQAGDIGESERAVWQAWLAQAESHRHAWQHVENLQAQLHQLPAHLVVPSLKGAVHSRRRMLQQLGVLVLVAPLGVVAWQTAPWQPLVSWQQWHAQYTTATGEQRLIALPDGSQLRLNTATAADRDFDAQARRINLYRGEIWVATAADQQVPARPFFVDTPHGRVQALGTRFTVRVDASGSRVSVLEKSVRIFPAKGGAPLDVNSGQQASFTERQTAPAPAPVHDAWWTGSLMVVDMPLRDLLNELSRYRTGSLSCSDDIAAIKISGAFPLNNTDRALAAITRSFPVREQRLTSWWVRLVRVE